MPLSFRKSKDSRNIDVDGAVRKLKSLYKEYSEQYGTKQFSLRGFEDRYRSALINKLNINTFLLAEIEVFEELKKRVEKPDNAGHTGTSYSEIADRIIENNLKKIRKYRCIDFHPDAEEETKYLLGAVTDFYYDIWGKVTGLLKTLGLKANSELRNKLESDFSFFAVPIRGSYSRAVDDYIIVLSRKNPKDNERATVNFMKNGGILLNNCLRLINDGLNTIQNLQESEGRLIELKRYKLKLMGLIEDFRLSDIRGY